MEDDDDYKAFVWTPQETWLANPNYANLKEFGEVKEILPRSSVPGQTPESALKLMMEKLKQYDPEDFIVVLPADPIGPFLLGLAMGIRGDWKDGINWLRYERPLGPQGERVRTDAGHYEVIRFRVKGDIG